MFLSLPRWLSSDSSRTCPSRKSQTWNRKMSKRATEKVNRTSRQPIKKKKTNKKKKENVSMRKSECERFVCDMARRSESYISENSISLSFSVFDEVEIWSRGREEKMTGVLCRWLICNKSECLSLVIYLAVLFLYVKMK